MTPEERYLQLLKGCLTRTLFPERFAPAVAPAGRTSGLSFRVVRRVLRRWDLVPARAVTVHTEQRATGADHPSEAETMIGLRRLDNLHDCVVRILEDGVAGDVLEAGVWRGGASIFLRGALAAYGDEERTVWLADSFQGLPPPDVEHYPADAGDVHWTRDELRVSSDQVRANFDRYGLLDDRVRLIEGFFRDTLAGAPVERLALLRVDGDMYESTIQVLEALYAKVSPGGYVVIDDYGAIGQCRTAVDDFRRQAGVSEPLEAIDWTGVFWRRSLT